MAILPLILMALGAFAVLALIAFAFAGPSPARAGARRLQLVRERHSSSAAAVVEARLRKITASRSTRMDDAVTRLLPRPALLKKRLAMTGKNWTVEIGRASWRDRGGQYVEISAVAGRLKKKKSNRL